ncbi:hypothetical protein ACIQB5_50425 [Streptomyces sp. NPDC088560]|uniref:hypothetical protein n=1 Tax=Streptomyces sp. NPDC088560 TaxID=3365868 RepID=UPI003806511A
MRIYDERWEIEITYLALRHTLLKGRVLRSKSPVGLNQEMWGRFTLHQALRSVMVTAVETMPGCDPDRAGFTVALEAARDTVVSLVGTTAASGPSSPSDLVGHIGARVLHALLPGRSVHASRDPGGPSASGEGLKSAPRPFSQACVFKLADAYRVTR